MASKPAERFKQEARMWQRDWPCHVEICSNRPMRNPLLCRSDFAYNLVALSVFFMVVFIAWIWKLRKQKTWQTWHWISGRRSAALTGARWLQKLWTMTRWRHHALSIQRYSPGGRWIWAKPRTSAVSVLPTTTTDAMVS